MKGFWVFYTIFLINLINNNGYAQKAKEESGSSRQQKERPEGKKGGGKQETLFLEAGNIVLGCPTNHSVEASIILGEGYEGFIEYSVEKGTYLKKTETFKTPNSEPVLLIIGGLLPNSQYYYRLKYRKEGEKQFTTSSESWFATQKSKSSAFSFAVQGDSHPERQGKMFNPVLYLNTIQLASQIRPDFYFMMGDDFSIDKLIQNNTATQNNIEKIYEQQRYYWGNAGKNPPLFLVNGNHEQAAKYLLNGTPDNSAVQAGLARKKYFPLPAPDSFYSGNKDTVQHVGLLKDYYAFEWGNALFVVIDPYWHSDVAVDNQPSKDGDEKKKKDPWGATLGKEQYDWLKKTLETSKATFKFVFAHHVNGTGRGGVERAKYFEWGGYGQNGQWQFDKYRPGWEIPIHQLFVKSKVTIFFQGHDHLFARQELDGVIYQSVPNPADDTYTAFNRDAYTSGDILPNSGFLNVIVNNKEVKVKYIRSFLQGSVVLPDEATKGFEYTIKK